MEDDYEDDAPGHYDDGNRAFLQAFMARGTLTFAQAQPILAAIFTALERAERRNNEDQNPNEAEPQPVRPADVTREDFDSYVSAASAAISPLDMEIRSATHQVTKERIWALVNTTSDPTTQLATLHSAEEIAFVRRVIDAMFDKYNTPRLEMLCVDGMQANKLRAAPRNADENGDGNASGSREAEDGDTKEGDSATPQTQTQTVGGLKGLKSSEVEQVMRNMVDEGWFERSREGFYSLSPRALMELRAWLVDAYNDPDAEPNEWQRVKFCEACREIVTVGQRCAERDCVTRLHDACLEAFWKTRKDRKCPRCSTEWSGKHFVGERAVTETEAYQRGRRRSGRGGRSSLVERLVDDGDEDDGVVD
ncbi:Nse1 non-SMC component of SMC5-6 complex-domain-containing protein [Hypomontagnella monticulosa]|nr:Nse1 non-SMC component of SMC5-6 complex-domain-containing protein [Hypomontagnella monticulosa]